jgi:hypothetical protein
VENRHRVEPIAQEYITLYESPDPARIHSYSPGLAIYSRPHGGGTVGVAGSRIVATIDLGGPGVAGLPGTKSVATTERGAWQGRVYTSDDRGRIWTHRECYPFMHARPFVAGRSVYVLGQEADLTIIRSDDGGESWSAPAKLTSGQQWHQAPCNVHYANGCVYLVMERITREVIEGWRVGDVAPVLMRAPVDADLTKRESWTFASELSFYEALPEVERDGPIDFVGIPFYPSEHPRAAQFGGRWSHPPGWLETNVVQFTDPDHLWCDPTGRTFHLWMRGQTNGTGFACVAKAVEEGARPGTGPITTSLESAPSGRKCLFVPCPGGQMKFHVLYDEVSKYFWLLSTQATDSMCRPDRLAENRYGLPYNQRRRLQLHFSKNMVDWCFAGLVATGPAEHASRHYASMVIDGNDLYVLSRSGDERAPTAHDGNIITFHTIREFRSLIY